MLRPELPVILSSGFNEMDSISRFADKRLAGFLQKPYAALALARKVQTVRRS